MGVIREGADGAVERIYTTRIQRIEDLELSISLDDHTDVLVVLLAYGSALWADCVKLESMWLAGELEEIVDIEEEELDIARSQPWGGSPALIASDGLFSFGADTRAGGLA